MKRLDQALIEFSLARSRTQAAELIKKGYVSVCLEGKWKTISKPSHSFDGTRENIRVVENSFEKYVSRGGVKLEGALKHTQLNVQGFCVLDIGISTGGFADCLLQKGARRVLGVDVGHGQLNEALQSDSRVMSFEGVNVRELTPEFVDKSLPGEAIDLAVIDLSFISLRLVLPVVSQLLPSKGLLLALIKPQFEVGAENLGRGGLVRNKELYQTVIAGLRKEAEAIGFQVIDDFPSSIEGGDGNTEFFLYAQKA